MAREPHKTNLIDLPHELLQSITSELKIKDIFKLAICSTISRLSVLDICQTKVTRLSLKLKEEQVCANCFPGVTMSQQRTFIPGDFFPFIRPKKSPHRSIKPKPLWLRAVWRVSAISRCRLIRNWATNLGRLHCLIAILLVAVLVANQCFGITTSGKHAGRERGLTESGRASFSV